jgi:Uma2 family endonuclease
LDVSAVIRFANYEDIQRLPEHVTGEILFGQLHTQPRPTSRHAGVETGIAAELRNPFGIGRGGPGGWVILVEPELHLSEHVMVPDLAGWRRERLPLIPDGPIAVVPDWVCEILSPATANKDRRIKLPLYGQLGVEHAWLIDPNAKTIEVMRFSDGHWVLLGTFGDDDSMRGEPFDAVAIDLAPLWAW